MAIRVVLAVPLTVLLAVGAPAPSGLRSAPITASVDASSVERPRGAPGRRQDRLGARRGRGGFAAAERAEADRQAGGEQSGQPPEVAPSHPVDQTRLPARSPPCHADRKATGRRSRPPEGRVSLLTSAAVTALYDLMLMLDPTAPDERHEEIVRDARSMIEADGELVGSHDWGTRRMAFEIDHRREAGYHLFQFDGAPDLLERLDQRLKIIDGVLRFRIIRLKPGSPPPPVPDRESLAAPRGRRGADRRRSRAAADAPAGAGAAARGRRGLSFPASGLPLPQVTSHVPRAPPV